jgi:uncharacterized delta-60 repeat protein
VATCIRRFALGALLATVPQITAGAPGALDPTFGVGGKVVTPIRNFALAQAAAIQPDGKVIVVGQSSKGMQVARYNPDGTLDRGFGSGGLANTYVTMGGVAVILQPDGRIVAFGASCSGPYNRECFVLVRFTDEGTLDPGFGSGGRVTTQIGPYTQPADLVLQSDGKIMAVGGWSGGSALVRYDANGTLDPVFGSGGKVMTSIGGNVSSVVVQPDGKFVVAGEAPNGPASSFLLARFNDDGTPDTSFGTGGTVTTSFGTRAGARDLVLQPDGKLVAVGWTSSGSSPDFALARYEVTGNLDPSFAGGTVITSFGSFDDQAQAALLQPDGKIIVVGHWSPDSNRAGFALARYDTDGTLDEGFGGAGTVTAPIGRDEDRASAVVLQPDGRLVVVGTAGVFPPGFPYSFALARFEGGPTPVCGADSDGDGVCDALDNCDTVPNPTQANGDADTLGDSCDPCTNTNGNDLAAGENKGKLVLTRLLGPAGDQRLSFKGVFAFVPTTPAIDPVANGLRVLVTDSTGATPVDIAIPSGAYDPVARAGWRVNGSGTAWTYQNAGSPVPPIGGIRKAQLRKAGSVPGKYKFTVQGRDASYPIDPAHLPLVGTFVIDTPLATTGQCAEVAFWAAPPPAKPRCVARNGGDIVKCG